MVAVGFSGSAQVPFFESSAYGTVLYILESVMPFIETFCRDFYFPDPQNQSNEMDEIDHLAKAGVVSWFVCGFIFDIYFFYYFFFLLLFFFYRYYYYYYFFFFLFFFFLFF